MLDSPFPHHGPLDPEQVRGRDALMADLIERVTAHRPTVLVAPRRYGKTSILGRLAADLADTTTVVNVDLYEIRSWEDFAARLDKALAAVTGPGRHALDRIAATLELDLGVVKASFTRKDPPRADIVADNLVDVLVAHATRTPTLVILDEFSSIDRVDGAAGMLRTKFQHHYRALGLVFAGSKPSTMRMLFSTVDQPFYGQADLLDVPPLTAAALDEIITEGFAGSPPAGLVARIHNATSGHPQRSMQLADAAWTAAQDRDHADTIWEEALDRTRRATADSHETRFAELPTAEQAVLRIVADGGAPYGKDAQRLDLAPSSAQNAIKNLLDRGLIAGDGHISVVDPLFADWLRSRF